jgi:ABC-type uncharacterized transport system substrate-binding protein
MDRRLFLGTLAGGLLFAPLAARAQPAKIWRIGYLSPAVDKNPIDEAFDRSMQELGYVEGQNIRMERRYVAGQPARFGGAAADLVSLNLDLIVVWSTSGMLAVKDATSSIPVVFLAGATGSWTGVAGLPRPGGNLTGITFQAELEPKYLQILKELIPNLTRVALIRAVSDNNPNANQVADAAAGSLGLKLFAVGLTGPEDLAKGFGRIVTEKSQALVAAPSGLLYAYRRQFVEFAAKNRLPTIYGLREVVVDGGLLSLSPSLSDIATRGTYYVDRILKGAKPADLPVEQPTKFELVINLKTARALGLTIPSSLLQRADQVIE